VAPGAPVTSVSRRPRASVPAVADALPPVAAALLALAFALLLVRSLLRRLAGQKVLWAAGFALFALAASCEAVAQRAGWSPAIVRRQRMRANVWIACGALTVAAATGLSRSGNTSLVYVGELVGIALMFCGFTLTSPARLPARAAEPAPRAVVAAR